MKSEGRNDFWFRYNEIISFIIDAGIAPRLLKGRPEECTSWNYYIHHVPAVGEFQGNKEMKPKRTVTVHFQPD